MQAQDILAGLEKAVITGNKADSIKFAKELGLRHENRPCGTKNLSRFLNRARELARASADKAQ